MCTVVNTHVLITSDSQLPGLSPHDDCMPGTEKPLWSCTRMCPCLRKHPGIAFNKSFPVFKTKQNSPFLTFLVCFILNSSCLPNTTVSLEVWEDSRNITLVAYHRGKNHQGSQVSCFEFYLPKSPHSFTPQHETELKSVCSGWEPKVLSLCYQAQWFMFIYKPSLWSTSGLAILL